MQEGRIKIPEPVGYWVVGNNIHYPVLKKPNWFHRKMTKLFFLSRQKDDSLDISYGPFPDLLNEINGTP